MCLLGLIRIGALILSIKHNTGIQEQKKAAY